MSKQQATLRKNASSLAGYSASLQRARHLRLLRRLLLCLCIVGLLAPINYLYYYLAQKSQSVVSTQTTVKLPDKQTDMHTQRPVIEPLAADDASLPKSYLYYAALSQRQVSVANEEVGGKAVGVVSQQSSTRQREKEKPISNRQSINLPKPTQTANNAKLNREQIPPIHLVSLDQNEKNEQNKANIMFQAASLRTEKDARAFIEKMQRNGFSARIERGTNAKGQIIYRVRTGPYSKSAVSQVRRRLRAMGVEPFEYHVHP